MKIYKYVRSTLANIVIMIRRILAKFDELVATIGLLLYAKSEQSAGLGGYQRLAAADLRYVQFRCDLTRARRELCVPRTTATRFTR